MSLLCVKTRRLWSVWRVSYSRSRRPIDSGAEGVIQASQTLAHGIELIYPHTNAHKAALKLYLLSSEGNLKPPDEPLNLINAALERAGI